MEDISGKLIPVVSGIGNELITIQAVTPLPVELSFVAALSGTKIKDATHLELKAAVSAAVEKAWFDLGLKSVDDDDYIRLKTSIVNEYKSCFGSMTLAEIGNAFHHWSRGKYGKVFGLTVNVAGKLMSDYLTDQERINAVKSTRPKELPAPTPGHDHLFNLGKDCLSAAHEKYSSKIAIGTLAPTVYNFLNEIGLIIYTKNEKWDFMVKALEKVIEEVRVMIITSADENKISGFKSKLNKLLAANQPDATLNDEECLQLVKNKAKELTLEDWFADCRENEFDIDQLVESKRDYFLQTRPSK